MRNASSAFKQALADGRVDYTLRAVVTLIDETVITLTNDDIWENGLVIDDAVSGDGDFQLGSAIINQCTISINNIYDDYSAYDFFGANVIVYVGFADLEGDTTEELLMGHYTVSDTAYNGSLITLTCLDNMMKFDKAYDSTLAYPATLGDIVLDACTHCGVTLDNSYLHFANYDYEVEVRPSGESTTYRQVISWAAQIAGCFARINSNGNLEIKFFDTVTLASYTSQGLNGGYFDNGSAPTYTSGDTADGGTFNPWNTGYEADGGTFAEMSNLHYIQDDFGSNLATDDVVITGVKVVLDVNSDTISQYASAYDETSTYAIGAKVTYENQLYECVSAISTPEAWTAEHWKDISQMEYTAGSAGYTISVEGNPLVTGGSAGQSLATYLGGLLIGMRFRTGSVTHPSDPTIEAGDLFVYTNRKMQSYAMLVSSTNFASGSNQTTQSSAATPQRNSAQRFSESTQTYVQLRKQIFAQKSYLEQQLAASGGLYYTEVPQPGGGSVVYYHDKPKLEDSQIQMVFSQTGFSLTNDGGTTWYGMTVDGTMIANILQATGINAEWINVGTELSGWTISSNRLYSRTTYPTASGEGTEAYVMMRAPSSMAGQSSTSYRVLVRDTVGWSTTYPVSVRFIYEWANGGSRTLTVTCTDDTQTVPQTFKYDLWWKEVGSSDSHSSSSAGTTSLTATVGDDAITGTIQASITIKFDIPAGLAAYMMYLNIALSDPVYQTRAPIDIKPSGCYLSYASDIPDDRIPPNAAFIVTNGSNVPRWYVASDGNMLAKNIEPEGIFARSANEIYYGANPVLYPGGGIAVYNVTHTPLTTDAPDNTDGGNVLTVGSPYAYMQMAFLSETDANGGVGIYTRYLKGATMSPWKCLTRPIFSYPVGSVYITDSNTNPSTILGGGTWTLIKRVFENKAVSDAVTWNSTNVVSSSGQAVFFVRDTRVTFRIRFTNKVAVGDTTLVMGTLNLSKVGLTGAYYGTYIAVDDTANTGVMMDIQSVNNEYQIRTIDVVGGGTIPASTSTNPNVTLVGELVFDTASIADSACNEFHWQRTA